MALTTDPTRGAERAIIRTLLEDYPNNVGLTSDQVLARLSDEQRAALGDNYAAQQRHVQTVRRYFRMVVEEMRRSGVLGH